MMDPWYLESLVCPRDRSSLRQQGDSLVCSSGHDYSIVDSVPVMLLDDTVQTMELVHASVGRAQGLLKPDPRAPHLYLESLGVSKEQKSSIAALDRTDSAGIDPVVNYLVAATSGAMYKPLLGKLKSYPIPEVCLPDGNGRTLLDLGCNWGRWSIAAAQKGYSVIGIDPSLGAIMAARRVSRQLRLDIKYLVADARFLPFPAESMDYIHSFGVLQHLDKEDARSVLTETARVLRAAGRSLIQMAGRFGSCNLYHQARRGFREGRNFEVRYWPMRELEQTFSQIIGPSRISAHCYFGLGWIAADAEIIPRHLRPILRLSEFLRHFSARVKVLRYVADSVFVFSERQTTHHSMDGSRVNRVLGFDVDRSKVASPQEANRASKTRDFSFDDIAAGNRRLTHALEFTMPTHLGIY